MQAVKRILTALVVLSMAVPGVTPAVRAEEAIQIYVAPNGADTNNGSAAAPFAKIERALAEVKKLKSSIKSGSIEVTLRGGIYYAEKGIMIDSTLSGTDNVQVVIKGYDNETAKITSAKSMSTDKIQKVTDEQILSRVPEEAKDKLYSVDLKALGISDFGKMEEKNNFDIVSKRTFDFYWNDQPMTIARWPNDSYIKTGKVTNNDEKTNSCSFLMAEDRISRWAHAADARVYGFFNKDWLDNYMPVSAFNIDKKEIVTKGYPSWGCLENKRFYVYNLLEEIDAEREYFLNRSTGILYFYPQGDIKTADFQFVLNSSNPIVTVSKANNIKFYNLHIGGSTNKGFEVTGSSNIRIENCQLFNVSDYGIDFGYGESGSKNCTVYGCEIRDIGATAIYATSGNMRTLEPGNLVIENNHIHRFGQKIKTYRPAVYLGGVGNKVLHNVMHDAPHEVIHFGGLENEIAYNEIYDALNETDDCGSIYGGRSFYTRNYIRNNFFHNYGATGTAIMAIYADDLLSGTQVENNIFLEVPTAFVGGGGRYMTVKNNLSLDKAPNGEGGMKFDQRGTTGFTKEYFTEGDMASPMLKQLLEIPYNTGVWAEKYPWLSNILEDEPGIPKHNIVQYNIGANSGKIDVTNYNKQYGTVEDNYDIGPVAYEITEDRKLKVLEPEKLKACKGFNLEALELDKIGVYGDGNYSIPKAEYKKTSGVKQTAAAKPADQLVSEQVKYVDAGELLTADTKKWDTSKGSIKASGEEAVIGPGKVGYTTEKYKNASARFKYKMDQNVSWLGVELRSSSTSDMPWTGKRSYLLVIKEQCIELQRWNGGSKMLDIRDNYYTKSRDEWTNIELRTYTADDGRVWLKVRINGVNLFDIEDDSEMLRNPEEGYLTLMSVNSGDKDGYCTIGKFDPNFNTVDSETSEPVPPSAPGTAEPGGEPAAKVLPITVQVNDKALKLDTEPYLSSGVTMVPFEPIFEAFGAKAEYHQETQCITSTVAGKRIYVGAGEAGAYVNGVKTSLGAGVELENGMVMVPLRFVAEAFGGKVSWDAQSYTVHIAKDGYVPAPAPGAGQEEGTGDPEPAAAPAVPAFDETKLIKYGILKTDFGKALENGPMDGKDPDKLIDFSKVEEPYNIRWGLPNFRYKLEETDAKLTVAFIGGSITQGTGYRDLACSWLTEKFGKRFEFINAGIGGTGSELANTRYYYDIAKYKPDLFLIEFAVNDSEQKSSMLAVESMIRQARQIDPTLDMMMVYTFMESGLDSAAEGRYTPVAKVQDYVAAHYGIPSVFMGYKAAKLAKEGKILFNGSKADSNSNGLLKFTLDGTHTTADGAKLYWEQMEPALTALLLEDSKAKEIPSAAISYLSKENKGDMIHINPAKLVSEAFTAEPSAKYPNWKNRTESVYAATKVGDGITFDFTGTSAGLLILSGGDCPMLDIIVDGQKTSTITLFLPYHGVTEYGLTTVSTPILEAGKHTVTFKISEEKFDKAKRVREVTNNEAQLTLIKNNPDFFNSTKLIIGSVFVNGSVQ